MTQAPQNPLGPLPFDSPYQQPMGPPSQTMARWALALSILGCIPFGFVVGAGLAIAVFVRSSDGRNYGTGKAIAALVIGGVWLLVIAALVVSGFVQAIRDGVDAERDELGRVTERSEIDLGNLREGDCFDDPELLAATTEGGAESATAEVIPCPEEHQFEAYYAFDLTGDDYPGEERVDRLANERCSAAFELFVGRPYERSTLDRYHYIPTPRSWSFLGDRTVLCTIASPEGPVMGTLRGVDR